MKNLLKVLFLFAPLLALAAVKPIPPAEAAKLVAEGKAILVDVREPTEWAETGVAAPAVLLPKSAFDGQRSSDWSEFLTKNRDKEIILYCRSGTRSGVIAEALHKEGLNVANAGGFRDWKAAGLPTREVKENHHH